ncbi:hypothetical protein GCM10025880_59850 [Methylorubrum aminovorans]|nr:hypothetical protein GCM10025880_59850 [Methylorubrum aminovorans]
MRRLALAGPTLATAAAIAALALAAYGLPETWLGRTVLGLFVVLMAWQSFTAWQYLYGFIAALMGDRALSPLERRAATISTRPTGLSRTAAVVAIHAEDPIAVFAAIRVMARSLQREGGNGSDIDIFVLSDTREGAISAVEEHEFARIQAWAEREGRGMPRIRYRRRTENTGRKAGNIAEFCQTYGHEYDFMIVLDADSLMTGAAMRRLARLMEENPRTGLIQTVSYAAGRDTLFARIQQFAVRLYAPLSLRCLETWQGPDGSYWGTTRSCGSRRSPTTPSFRCSPAGRHSAARFSATTSSRAPSCAEPAGKCACCRKWAAPGRRCRPTSSTYSGVSGAGARATCSTSACCR